MKKKLAVLIGIATVVSVFLTGCGNRVDDDVLTMATNAEFPPYEYYDGDQIVGIDVEIAQAIAEELGMGLKISDMEFDDVLANVAAGKYDIGLAGITVSEDRLKDMDFSDSYAKGVQSIIVLDNSPIAAVYDLYTDDAAYIVGVQQTTTGDIYATDDFGADRVKQFHAGYDAVEALLAGEIDCVIIDNEPAKSFAAVNEGLKILDTFYAEEEYAICTAKGNDAFLDNINKAIEKLKQEGTIDSIINKYIPTE